MKCIGFGRFVRDPVLKAAGNTNLCEFSLAMDEFRKVNGERRKFTNYFDFVIWDKAAELIVEYRKKGDLLHVEASAKQDKWVDKTTGGNRSKIIFRVDNFQFLPRGNSQQTSQDKVEQQDKVESQPEPEPEAAF